MSTDMVLATTSVAEALETKILFLFHEIDTAAVMISTAAKEKLEMLVSDARKKGAPIHTAPLASSTLPQSYPPTVVVGLTTAMDFYEIESFGPIFGILSVETEDKMFEIIQRAKYGLSSSIILKGHFRALELGRSIKAGAVHINSMTVHDEPTLPHGGYGESG